MLQYYVRHKTAHMNVYFWALCNTRRGQIVSKYKCEYSLNFIYYWAHNKFIAYIHYDMILHYLQYMFDAVCVMMTLM